MSWGTDRRDAATPYAPGPRRKTPRVPLTIRLLIAVVLAVALALGTSYTLRTLNL